VSVEFTYCPACGGQLEAAREDGRRRMRCPVCGYVQYRNPAPAVGVIVRRGSEVLLVKRRHEPYRGKWTLPSGFIEYDEDMREAAVREVEEETGLEVVLLTGRITGGGIEAGDDAEDAAFFPLDRLPEIAFEAHRTVLKGLADRLS